MKTETKLKWTRMVLLIWVLAALLCLWRMESYKHALEHSAPILNVK